MRRTRIIPSAWIANILSLIFLLSACQLGPASSSTAHVGAATSGTTDAPSTTTRTQVTTAPRPQLNTVYPFEEAHVILDEETGEGYVDNIIVVFVTAGTRDETVLSWFLDEQASIAGRFPGLGQLQLRIKPRRRAQLEALATQLMARPEVRFAHIDYASWRGGAEPEQRAAGTAGRAAAPDGSLPEQSKPGNEWWHEAIQLAEARPLLPRANYVKVGVVDDGFDTTHPDLRLRFPNDAQARLNLPEVHGTHVAGIVQQLMPGATITVADSYPVPETVPGAHIGRFVAFTRHLVDMVEADVRVINYSMGSDLTDEKLLATEVELAAVTSVYIWLLRQSGRDFLLVQSAGNVGIDAYRNGVFCTLNRDNCLGSEAVRRALGVESRLAEAQQTVFDSIVVVGAAGRRDARGRLQLLEGTNHGDKIDLIAPGTDINSTVPGGYMLSGGTSQAAPIVSAALGLLWTMKPQLSSAELKQLLIRSATERVFHDGVEGSDKARRDYPLLDLHQAACAVRQLG